MKRLVIILGCALACVFLMGATSVSFNGTSYSVPEVGEENWGGVAGVDGLLVALATHSLQKTGGTFTLSADVDFGASAGLKSIYYKSRASSLPTTGILRMGNTETIAWRNAADSANVTLYVDSSNALNFNGTRVMNSLGVVPSSSGGTGIASYQQGDMLQAQAGSLALGVLNIGAAYEVMQASGSLATWGLIDDNNIAEDADITRTKLAQGTAEYVLINDGSGEVSQEQYLDKSRGGAGADMSSVDYPTSGSLVTSTGTYTLSNKTMESVTLNGGLTVAEIASPSTPSSGYVKLYAKNDNNLYFKDDGGTESQLSIGQSVGREGPSSSAISLSSTSYEDVYIASPGSAINQDLPSTNVVEGKKFRIIVSGATVTNDVTIRSSDNDTITIIEGSGFVLVQALQDTPTDSTHWQILEYQETMTHSITFENSASSGDNGTFNATLRRWTGGHVSMDLPAMNIALSGGAGFLQTTSGSALPTRFRPATRRDYMIQVQDNGATQDLAGRFNCATDGRPTIVKQPSTTSFTNGTAVGIPVGINITWTTT